MMKFIGPMAIKRVNEAILIERPFTSLGMLFAMCLMAALLIGVSITGRISTDVPTGIVGLPRGTSRSRALPLMKVGPNTGLGTAHVVQGTSIVVVLRGPSEVRRLRAP